MMGLGCGHNDWGVAVIDVAMMDWGVVIVNLGVALMDLGCGHFFLWGGYFSNWSMLEWVFLIGMDLGWL